ncbi:SIR2 family protein [Roseiconus lacunae]|uniref:SIR2 family protein n=1 Tax=Roseiconus lacunae TaxID=2605694 RepID=UPI001E477E61|nr:SIR2 family protein [Roseiconus lacunae]MCD0460692.1 SIR2 family protein [Roseiconus lacunae]
MKISLELAAKRYTQALLDENAALFAGAGLSIPSGFVSWSNLLRELADELGVEVSLCPDLPTLAQYHVNETGNRGGINQVLVEEFVRQTSETESHRLIAKMPIRTIWTTNYDRLIEQAIENSGKIVEINRRPEDLTSTVRNREAIVYKMHGDMTELHRGVLTRDDFEQYDRERGLFRSALEGDLVQKTFLFAGFSFDDPNINFVLSRTRVALGQSQREHFYLLRSVARGDFTVEKYGSDEACEKEFGYAQALQDLRVRDLSRYGIRTVLLDDYGQVEEFFRMVERRYKRNSVFISGAAVEHGSYEEREAREFIGHLSGGLVGKGFRVINGYGLGVGPAVVSGVLERAKLDRRKLDRCLLSRPFPIFAKKEERERKNEDNRREMIEAAGIAIFVFGTKTDPKGKVIPSPGVEREYELARSYGIPCIAIGCTGGMSQKLSKEIVAVLKKPAADDEPESIAALRRANVLEKIHSLNVEGADLKAVVSDVIEIVEKLRDCE